MRTKIAFIIAILIMLCGCGEDTIDGSLRVPQLPEEYVEFNDEINKIKNEGFELVSPNGGTNRQSVQLTDLDNDGIDEGVAFFREIGNAHKVYAYFFEQNEEGYGITAKIEGSGDTVENVTYADLMGNGNNEVIIGWSLSDSGAKSVGVYSVTEEDSVKLCEVNSLYHIACDLNGDMVNDLCVVYQDPADGKQKLAFYSQDEGNFIFRASAPLSAKSDVILRIRAAYIDDMQPAVFVEKRHGSAGVITDVITWKDKILKNLTYSDTAEESEKTARTYEMYCEDVDLDGALEIPIPGMPVNGEGEGEIIPGVSWYGVGKDYKLKAFTFRSSVEKWNVSLPLDWRNRCVAIYRKMSPSLNVSTVYSYKEDGTREELFSIMAISGENREKNMEKLGYEKLSERGNTLYAIQIKKKRYLGYDITAEMLAERFTFREAEWSTGEVVF